MVRAGACRLNEVDRKMSSGHFVGMLQTLLMEAPTCKWLHVQEENEWSLMMSLIRRFLVPV